MEKPVYLTTRRWNSYKTQKKTKSKPKCSICLLPLIKFNKWDRLHKGLPVVDNTDKNSLTSTLHCQHKFHSICIFKWLENEDTCPNCRCQIIKN